MMLEPGWKTMGEDNQVLGKSTVDLRTSCLSEHSLSSSITLENSLTFEGI
ncbi:MAG: hypothetical protein O3C43_22665 [Verrucomicrobia bacterium]|nr:hypothetical protein [Verrucomicrobiota bacterium]